MSQNDFNLANQGFPSMRSDMNSALQALASNSAGATAPTTTYPYQWWYDETTDILKVRDAANAAWIAFATFDQGAGSWSFTSDVTIPDRIIHAGDTNTQIRFPANDTVTVETNGAEVLRVDASGNLSFNSGYGSAAVAYGCRAWVNFKGSSTLSIRASGNVSSVIDNGTGDYTINFATAMPDVNYSVTGAISSNSNSAFTVSTVDGSAFNLVGSVKVVTAFANALNNNYFDPDDVYIAIFR